MNKSFIRAFGMALMFGCLVNYVMMTGKQPSMEVYRLMSLWFWLAFSCLFASGYWKEAP